MVDPLSDENPRTLLTDEGKIPYILKRSARRRTMEISISSQAITRVVAPRFVPLETIENFIHSKSRWIIEKVAQKQAELKKYGDKKYETGHDFLFMGKAYPLSVDREANASTKIIFSGDRFEVRAHPGTSEAIIKAKLIVWYRRQAKEIFGGRVFYHSRLMGLAPQKITVKTQKRLWGSCNHRDQSVNLNWMLIMAPLPVIDYVIVHELCHLEVPNHSRRFWAKVAKFMPDFKQQELWLKTHVSQMRLP